MLEATKQRLHELVDALPEDEIEPAKKYLESLVSKECDPVLQEFLNAPEDDEPLTEEELKAIEEGEEAIARGETRDLDEVLREYGL
jgi:hypothetical protein